MSSRTMTATECVAVELNEAWPGLLCDGLQDRAAAVAVQEIADQIELAGWCDGVNDDAAKNVRRLVRWLREGAQA